MGQFKPMVKMETTEPSIELKLKKGGSVAHKKMKTEGHGHKSMTKMMDGGILPAGALTSMAPAIAARSVAPVSRAPARPSLAARRKAMVARPVKKGGEIAKLFKGKETYKEELNEGKAIKAGKISPSEYAKGEESEKAMCKGGKTKYKTGGVVLGNAGGFKTGGVIKGNSGGYKTGGVALGNAGGFKKGGKAKKYAAGDLVTTTDTSATPVDATSAGPLPADQTMNPVAYSSSTASPPRLLITNPMPRSGRNERDNDNRGRDMSRGQDDDRENETRRPRPISSAGSVRPTGATAVRGARNQGGYNPSPIMKKGGSAKKAYANGGSVNDAGKAISMPQGKKPATKPVAINMLSGTYKKGGRVKQLADGGPSSDKDFELAVDSFKKKLRGQGAISDEERRSIRSWATGQEKKYPSGLTDSDIDRIINSKEVKEGASHFSDYKRGGKAKK